MIQRTLLVTALLLGLITTAPAQEQRDSWHALPEQTVFVVRAPEMGKTIAHLRENTKFGKVMLDETRWSQLMQLVKEDPDGEWDEMEANLAKVGLTPEDLISSWSDPWGMAMVVEPVPGQEKPVVMMLVWMDSGEEKATKFVSAIERAIEEQADEEYATKRVDMELGGHKVIHLKNPEIKTEYDWEGEWEEAEDGMEEGFVQPRQMGGDEEAAEEAEDIKVTKTQVDQSNAFITRMGGRIVAGISIPVNEARYTEIVEADADAKVDFDEISRLKEATGVFARFLEAHDDDDYDYTQRLVNTPGMLGAMPKGSSLFEMYGDFRPLMKMFQNFSNGAEIVKWLELLGVSDLKTMALKVAADGNVMRTGLFVAAPAPRRGLLSLLDQPKLQPKPASWVPAHVVDYTHLSFDLGAAYKMVKDMVIDEMGEVAEQGFQRVDVSVQSIAQADMQTVLSALGNQHMFVNFESKLAEKVSETKPGDLTRVAAVWKLRDEAVWQKMLMALAMLQATPMGQQMEMVDEQGFTGWRMAMPEMELAVMTGKGYLTMAIGNGVSTEILNVLRSAPEGKAALATGELIAESKQVFESKPGIGYRLIDGNRTLRQLVATLSSAFAEGVEEGDMDDEQAAQMEKLKEIMPTREELEGALGVGGGHLRVTDDGLVSEDFMVMPE